MFDVAQYVEHYLAAVAVHEDTYGGRDLHTAVGRALCAYGAFGLDAGAAEGYAFVRRALAGAGVPCGVGAVESQSEDVIGADASCVGECESAGQQVRGESGQSCVGSECSGLGRGSSDFGGSGGVESRVLLAECDANGGSHAGEVSSGSRGSGLVESGVTVGDKCRGGQYWRNKKKREKAKAIRGSWRERACDVAGEAKRSDSAYGSGGSVCTVDTRTGVEIAAAQTLAARRVAENERAEAEAKVARKLAEHRLAALQDKDRTVAVQRLAAARYEQRINEAKAKSQASYKKCDESMKSLGSTGSAGEFALKQAVKEAKDNAITLKYVQEQAEFLLQHVTPEIRQRVAEMPEPEYEDEFEVFGDCPSDYDEEQREAYYDDLNRRNANHGLVGSSSVSPRRELTPEEFLKIEEEIRALSANQV